MSNNPKILNNYLIFSLISMTMQNKSRSLWTNLSKIRLLESTVSQGLPRGQISSKWIINSDLQHSSTEVFRQKSGILQTSQELQMLSRSLSDCQSLTLNRYSSMSWFKFRNLSVIVNCVTKSLNRCQSKSKSKLLSL